MVEPVRNHPGGPKKEDQGLEALAKLICEAEMKRSWDTASDAEREECVAIAKELEGIVNPPRQEEEPYVRAGIRKNDP